MPFANSWVLNNSAISVEQAPGNGRALSLAHAAYPYVRAWKPATGGNALISIAGEYLYKVKGLFDFPANLELDPQTGQFTNQLQSRLQLTWLPLEAGSPIPTLAHGARDPRKSFWVRRKLGSNPNQVQLNLVLIAVPTLLASEASAIGSRLGLRVTARVQPRAGADWLVAITGASCSTGLIEMLGPQGPKLSPDLVTFLTDGSANGFKNAAKVTLRAVASLAADSLLFIEGFRILSGIGNEASIEIHAHIPRAQQRPNDVAYALTARAIVLETGQLTIDALERSPLVAHQNQVNLFEQDPPSLPANHTIVEARANRSPQELAPFTVPCVLPGLPAGAVILRDDRNQVEVRQSELAGGDPAAVEPVPAAPRDPRTNAFGAFSSYMHARALFDRMRGYGLVLDDYFKFARFPLIVRYRTTISPGPGKDGRTVNAAVDYDPPRVEFGQGVGAQDLREQLQVRYALGDLKRSASRREPLSMAADPRWSWHEFGHVLLAASTGGLELPFAHSVGDALAAIACDPDSRLAATYQNGSLRGATFPWVHACRRHDREVGLGWGWCGSYHRPARLPEYVNNRLRKGYHSEQVLSSSLFRLYRSLGGDDTDALGNPDPAARLRAADYVIYLIMKAIQDLPPAVDGSAESPEQFVNALIAADSGTLPAVAGPLAGRVGGWAHKVVRWAFEAQGLYGNVAQDVVSNAPGEPPAVDVFIDTLRPRSEGRFPDGGYMPVSLHWDVLPGQEPWLATPQAMEIRNRRLRVTVRNRNGAPVNNVRVRAWVANWPQAQANPPPWDHAAWNGNTAVWTELQNSPSQPRDIPLGGARQFPPFRNLPAAKGRYVVLAAVLCAEDEPNMRPDVALALPTAANPTPLVDLVAGDNNLGLVIYNVP